MRRRLAQWCRRLALWLDPPVGLPDPVRVMAQELTRRQEVIAAAASGEYKRHQVYAALVKAFPLVRHRDLGLAIELALQDQESTGELYTL